MPAKSEGVLTFFCRAALPLIRAPLLLTNATKNFPALSLVLEGFPLEFPLKVWVLNHVLLSLLAHILLRNLIGAANRLLGSVLVSLEVWFGFKNQVTVFSRAKNVLWLPFTPYLVASLVLQNDP